MKTIGLCMIVKNESKIIRECLSSTLPIVDYILVVDTGSVDGTQQIVRDFLAEHGVKGKVVEEPWRNFAYNRTFALERLREVEGIDYAMIIDADDLFVPDEGFDAAAFKSQINLDFYDIEIFHGDVVFTRPQLLRNSLPFCWKGVLHEYVEAPPGNLTRGTAEGFRIRTRRGGARSENPTKYQDDAALLERALAAETDPFLISRYTFYLAQSYKDCGEREKALANYLKRVELGYWIEEVYIALLEAGNLMAALDRPFDEVIATYERATQKVPWRAEALHAAAFYCRKTGKNVEGMEFARRGKDLPVPPGGLFVQRWIYEYAILDEFAVNAYWAGAYRESLEACLTLLASDKLPPAMVKRVAANARFALDKLLSAKAPELGVKPTVSSVDKLPSAKASEVGVKPTFESCPICNAISTTKPRPDLEPHPYVSCNRCGLLYQPYMQSKVFEGHHETRGDLMSAADRQANRQLARALYHNHLARRFKGQELLHLDIGSKYPFFGHCLQSIGAEAGTQLASHGIDGIPEARDFGRQLGVLMAVGDFEAGPQSWDMPEVMRERVTQGKFHCVTLIHCLEHFYDPLRMLRQIRRLMADGGVLFIRSPDSRAPGIERDFTPGHYSIHPTIWCNDAMYEALATLRDAFVVYEDYEIAHQRDYLLQAIDRKPTVGVGLVVQNDEQNVGAAIESVAAVGDRFCVRRTASSGDLIEKLRTQTGDKLDAAPLRTLPSQGDREWGTADLEGAHDQYVEALDGDVDWLLRIDADDTVPPDTLDIVRRAPFMPFDAHGFDIRTGADVRREYRLWRTKRGIRYADTTRGHPAWPAGFRIRDWSREIVHGGISRAADILRKYRDLKAEAEKPGVAGQSLYLLAAACRDAYGISKEKRYLEEALSACHRYLASASSRGRDPYRLMAECYLDLGQDWEAAAAARRALEYAPHDEALRTWVRERTPRVINLLRPGAIGDVLASSAVTAQLAAQNPDIEIHYYTKIPEMAELLVGVHKVFDADRWAQREPGADFNLIGYPIAEGYPERPMQRHLTDYFCSEARLPRGVPRLKEELEPFDIGGPWITIHPKSGWSVYKDWDIENWNEIVRRVHRGHPGVAVIQIGGRDDPALDGIDRDLRGRTSIAQSLWLLKNSVLHLGVDSFTNHAAGAFGHPAVILFGSTSPTGSGYDTAVNLWAGLSCSPCYREDPRISRQSRGPCINPPGQTYDKPRHACMAAVRVETVWRSIEGLFQDTNRKFL